MTEHTKGPVKAYELTTLPQIDLTGKHYGVMTAPADGSDPLTVCYCGGGPTSAENAQHISTLLNVHTRRSEGLPPVYAKGSLREALAQAYWHIERERVNGWTLDQMEEDVRGWIVAQSVGPQEPECVAKLRETLTDIHTALGCPVDNVKAIVELTDKVVNLQHALAAEQREAAELKRQIAEQDAEIEEVWQHVDPLGVLNQYKTDDSKKWTSYIVEAWDCIQRKYENRLTWRDDKISRLQKTLDGLFGFQQRRSKPKPKPRKHKNSVKVIVINSQS